MHSPPGAEAPTRTAITGTRTNAETKRQMAGRIVRCMKAQGMNPQGWQIRTVLATLLANREVPTEEEILLELMRAPWFKKPTITQHQVGDPGWRTHT